MRFNIYKYKEWLREREKIDNVSIDLLLGLNGMFEYHGLDMDMLWKQGIIILKEWCDVDDRR